MDDTRDETGMDPQPRTEGSRTAAATAARQAAADEKMADRIRERGWIAFRPEDQMDGTLSDDLRDQLVGLIQRGMAVDALIAAHFAGWLGGAKAGKPGRVPAGQYMREESTGKMYRMDAQGIWEEVPACPCGTPGLTYDGPVRDCPIHGEKLSGSRLIVEEIRQAREDPHMFKADPFAGLCDGTDAGHHPSCACRSVDIPCKPEKCTCASTESSLRTCPIHGETAS